MTTPTFLYTLDSGKVDPVSAMTATDDSGNSNTGTLVGYSSSGSIVSGQVNQALDFNGSTQYIKRAGMSWNPAAGSGHFTMAMWVNPDTVSGSLQTLMGKWYESSKWGGYLHIASDGTIRFGYRRAGVDVADQEWNTHYSISAGVWTHIAITYVANASAGTAPGGTDETFRLYVNGVLTASSGALGSQNNLQDSSAEMGIGALKDNGTWKFFFNGKMDDVRLYLNYALTSTEIASIAISSVEYSLAINPVSYTYTPVDISFVKHLSIQIASAAYAVSIMANRIGRNILIKFRTTTYQVKQGWHSPKPDWGIKRRENKWWRKVVHWR